MCLCTHICDKSKQKLHPCTYVITIMIGSKYQKVYVSKFVGTHEIPVKCCFFIRLELSSRFLVLNRRHYLMYLVVRTLSLTKAFSFLILYLLSFFLKKSDIREYDKLFIALSLWLVSGYYYNVYSQILI